MLYVYRQVLIVGSKEDPYNQFCSLNPIARLLQQFGHLCQSTNSSHQQLLIINSTSFLLDDTVRINTASTALLLVWQIERLMLMVLAMHEDARDTCMPGMVLAFPANTMILCAMRWAVLCRYDLSLIRLLLKQRKKERENTIGTWSALHSQHVLTYRHAPCTL